MILCVLSFTLTTLLLLLYPYGANYGEAPLLDQARHLSTGKNIYKPSLQSPPYVIANYPPFYPFFIGRTHRLLHLPLFFTGRMVSILSAITSSVLLGLFARKLFNSTIAGFLAAGLFLGHPYVGLWSGLVRVDSLALALSLAGLRIAYSRWRSNSWLALALICLLASIYTRQTFLLAAPLACVVWLFHNEWKRGLTFAAVLTLLGLSTFLILNTVTHGGFYRHIVISNVNKFSFERIMSMGTLFIIIDPVLLILAVIAMRRVTKPQVDPFMTWGLLPYTIGTLVITLTVGKIGSDINYFLELIGASAIWAGGIWLKKPGRMVSLCILIHTAWVVAFSAILFQVPLVKAWRNIHQVDTLAQQVQAEVNKGPVLADDRLDLVVLASQDIYYQPFEYTQLYDAGEWDITAFTGEITSHKFPLILIGSAYHQERWPLPIYNAILNYYTCKEQPGLLVCQP
jgi:hypothetical protein